MNTALSRFAAGTGLAACLATSIGCYPAYPPPNANGYAYSQDAKGYASGLQLGDGSYFGRRAGRHAATR